LPAGLLDQPLYGWGQAREQNLTARFNGLTRRGFSRGAKAT